MKPFLGVDITENKENDKVNGEEFITRSISLEQSQLLEKTSEKIEALGKSAKLALGLRIIEWISAAVAIASAFVFFEIIGEIEEDLTLIQMYNKNPWLVWAGAISGIIWLVLWLLGYKKKKKVMSSYDAQRVFSTVNDIEENIYYELGVPENAAKVDILAFGYKIKGDELKVKAIGDNLAPYQNIEYCAFVSDNRLCLVDKENRYEFELSSLRAIHTVKKKINITDWNKDEKYNKGQYKQYKIVEDDNIDTYFVKPYHILELEYNGEMWGIYFPCYEKETFENLTGLTTENI